MKQWFGWSCVLAVVLVANTCDAAPGAIILVRHAEKAATGSDPGLTEMGKERAKALARMLLNAEITAVFTSRAKRTKDTAGFSAKLAKVTPSELIGDDARAHAKRILAANGKAVLVVGHSNTIPEIIQALGGPADISIDDAEFDRIFILVPQDGTPPKVLLLRYGM